MKSHNYSGSGFKVSRRPVDAGQVTTWHIVGRRGSGSGVPNYPPHTKTGRAPGVIVILLLIFLTLAPSSGKVFLSRFLTQGRSIFDTTGSWRRIYQAPLTINGAQATLSIHGCDEPLELVKTRLKQSFGSPTKNSFWMLSGANNQTSRLLALAMPGSGKSLVFVIDQSSSELSKPTTVPPESVFSGDALLPGSTVETIIKNKETGALLETRLADAAPDVIIGDISAKLSRHGWKQIYPGETRTAKRGTSPAVNHDGSQQCFMIFQRGEALCTLLAGPALRENKSCVTILLKEKPGQ